MELQKILILLVTVACANCVYAADSKNPVDLNKVQYFFQSRVAAANRCSAQYDQNKIIIENLLRLPDNCELGTLDIRQHILPLLSQRNTYVQVVTVGATEPCYMCTARLTREVLELWHCNYKNSLMYAIYSLQDPGLGEHPFFGEILGAIAFAKYMHGELLLPQ